ncbi:hypothetical protein ACPB9E_36150 [Streptomyces exfoliatus]|uniref:hypothetical protein n=1 Tax=Streptomyces exfoliatus TaxID=1905 RepID=UPI003C2D2DEA
MPRRLLLLRRAALADRRAYATEVEYLRGGATVTQTELALDKAEAAATVQRVFDVDTEAVYAPCSPGRCHAPARQPRTSSPCSWLKPEARCSDG